MPTLIVEPRALVGPTGGAPAAYANEQRLIAAADALGWSVRAADADPAAGVSDPAVYVSTDRALDVAAALGLALLEPPLDLLTRVPDRYLRRRVEAATFGDLGRLRGPTFVKPADPLDKWFDAGVYADVRDIRTRGPGRPDAPVLLSEVVEWSVELRYFVHDGRAVAGSPYLACGSPAWRCHPRTPSAVPPAGLAVVEGVCAALAAELPPAFVLDVGRIDDRGWAVVEFNPVWSAGLLNADPRAVLPALRAATHRG
jgi:hypothetical protein